MAVISPPSLSAFHPDLIRAVKGDAERDADLVGAFLDVAGLAPSGRRPQGAPLALPGDCLLRLAAALRLSLWEQLGIRVHLDHGLPPARQALLDVLRTATGQAEAEAAERARSLASRVMVLSVEHFAWVARVELGAELTLGPADEDALLEGLADFLWAHRPT
jgi:hypothetical protein